MRALLTTISVLVAALASLAPAYAVEVEVISGDAFRLEEKEWRIANIDAPKLTKTCRQEIELAYLAQAKLAQFLSAGEMEIAPTGARDQNQRAMAHVRIDGRDVGEMMLAERLVQRTGYARPLCVRSSLKEYQQRPARRVFIPRRGTMP